MILRRLILSLLLLAAIPAPGGAHFIWVTTGSQSKDQKAHVYFSESASPDDPALLNKILELKLWQVGGDGKATLLTAAKDGDSLSATLPGEQSSTVFTSHDYGVMSRGNDTFVLRYHAKSQSSLKAAAVNDPKLLPLEITARAVNDQSVLTVLWQGKPLAGSAVVVAGPGIEKSLEDTTNDKGEVSFALKEPGLYSIRARHTETATGERDGKTDSSIRHYATLSLSVSDKSTSTAGILSESSVATLPMLEPGITSFGAAIVDQKLYLYGGHLGKPHHYSRTGQSDQLLQLDLKNPVKWEAVATGPKRTGLAAVGYAGKFYRIGGFEARNEEAEKQSLWSTNDFARFDPQSGTWEELPSLPSGRSSHDALVIGSQLYVVGGWELKGEGNTTWHDTAYVVDLAAPTLEWKALPRPPFQRRALSLGEYQGRIYVIGGMQPEGGPTTATAFFDPKMQKWSDGPKLNGEPMEGFGSSAFSCGGHLWVSTFGGSVQMLSADGTQWVNSGKLNHPRFFHRMLPLNASSLLVVGGASMKSGKVTELETMTISSNSSGD